MFESYGMKVLGNEVSKRISLNSIILVKVDFFYTMLFNVVKRFTLLAKLKILYFYDPIQILT